MTYAGLCVDGPMDGQRIEQQTGKFQVDLRPPARITDRIPQPERPVDTTTVWYHWHAPGLWLLEGVGPEAAMTRMAETIGLPALASRYEQIVARQKDDANHGR